MNDWRKPCGAHGRFEKHPRPDAIPTMILGSAGMVFADEDWCPGGSPVTAADLEGLGEKIDWCVLHDSEAMHWVGELATTCTRAFGTDEPCEFERRLLIPIPDPQRATEGT